ncbi:MAG: 23S rRNA (adenine(2503)-C(2))-methyltransferase RlmN [Planctomycetota bacterium]|nr:23S rRNA (adenine(2503)-C(2))-methyltransferase RlmN [Planctomycetota bacterium]
MTEPTPKSLSCLGLPSDRFIGAARPAAGVARPGALAAYRDFFRKGQAAAWLDGTVPPVGRVLREDSPEGEVVKFVTRVPGAGALRGEADELDIESVLIPMINSRQEQNYTLCLSSQVGCAMGCRFCETAQMGLVRSLSAAEIVAQWWNAAHVIGVRPKNLVFMGMGEPMDNLDAVIDAIDVLRDHNGPHVPASQITVSTVGRVDGIRRLAQKIREPGWHRLGLALSLNAPNDADREAIMPINRRWNLADVQQALLDWPRTSGNKVCIEYVLIPGVNDSPRHAREIAEFMKPFGLLQGGRIAGAKVMAMLNLIPYNPRRNSPWPAPPEHEVARFLGWLIDLGVFAKRRRTKGRDLMGACGQLGTDRIRQRRLVQVTTSA